MRRFHITYRDPNGAEVETTVAAISKPSAKYAIQRLDERIVILDVSEDGPPELKELLRF